VSCFKKRHKTIAEPIEIRLVASNALSTAKGIVPKNKSNEVATQPIPKKNNTKVLNPRNMISTNNKIIPIAKKISGKYTNGKSKNEFMSI
tara:strand:+ start:6389 stop:6658 length:270 start_codon:yes stop_codon:yes gene_type:complete